MFREDKATQLAAYFIKKSGAHCNYLVLIKMMYNTDREMLLRWGMPVTYDTLASLPNGPVLSSTLNLIRLTKSDGGCWATHIAKNKYEVELISDPGDSALSDAEIEIADESFEKFGSLTYREATDLAHEIYPEWRDPKGTSLPIGTEDILRTAGFDGPEYLAEVQAHYQLNELLSR